MNTFTTEAIATLTPVGTQVAAAGIETGKAFLEFTGLTAGTVLLAATAARMGLQELNALTPDSAEEGEAMVLAAMGMATALFVDDTTNNSTEGGEETTK